MHITDTLEMVERAYDDWKEGRWSREPYVDMLIPTQIDPTMTPDGKHYMSVFVQYCPYQLADGEWTPGEAPGLRPDRHRCHRPPQPGLQGPDPARGDPHAAGHRERGRADRGQHLPGRTDLRSAAVQPPDSRLRAVPRAAARHVHVRLEHASGRRGHGRARGELRQRDPARPGALAVSPQLRQHHHRRRPQRPGVRDLPGARRSHGAGAGGRRRAWAGAAITREFAPGFRVSACAHLLHLMPAALHARAGAGGTRAEARRRACRPSRWPRMRSTCTSARATSRRPRADVPQTPRPLVATGRPCCSASRARCTRC